ncbi:MAG: glutathione S-transferase family protein [Hyphomicrobiales bacterium]|nr:glutathione S-transferase family protein [Hyphomicrobiales bacterium]
MMTTDLVLYHGMASTCSKKVRLALYEKELSFESHLLDLQKFEQHTPDYLALNPNGVVPTLVYKGKPVIESSIIIEFIEDAYPQKPLRPRDPGLVADVRLWLKFSDNVAYNAVYVPTWSILSKRAQDSFSEDRLQEVLARIPTRERRERWETVAREGFSEKEMQDAYEKMGQCLDRIEAAAARGPWLIGEMYSLADIAMIPFIDRIRNLRPEFLDEARYPGVNRWEAALRERPAFEKAFNFHDDPRAADLPNM